MDFKLASDYEPRGDQPEAIAQLTRGLTDGDRHQVLLGVTGSGKTFTMAKVIEQANRPAIVLAHNKTLAAQLFHEFKRFFPQNAVEYFVSYYDYYQPEAYVPGQRTLSSRREANAINGAARQAAHEREGCRISTAFTLRSAATSSSSLPFPASTALARPRLLRDAAHAGKGPIHRA